MQSALTTGALVVASVAVWAAPALGQFVTPPPPPAYALQGVTLVAHDGSEVKGVTIVVRGRLIEAIGPNVPVPADAEVLEGDSLRVYPGMVDAHGKAAVKVPTLEIERNQLPFWSPPRDAQGFMPHRRTADYLTAKGADLKSEREKGVVAGAILPDGSVMPGRGAVLLYRKSATTPTELIVRPELGPLTSFRGASGMYPSTVFGMSALLRQAFEDARHHGLIVDAHARDPKGLDAPAWDPDYAVLRDVMAGRAPVFFAVDRADEIRRALELAQEYGFATVIVGGHEAWRVADLLKARDVPVLVSVDYTKPDRWKPVEPKEGEEPKVEPLDAAAAREKRTIEAQYANAGKLAAAGVRFALTSGGKADLREGVRKAMEYGLSERAALAAVSTTPAAILGVPYVTRVESGLPATFIVTNGPLFGKDTKILHTFVSGEHEKGGTARAAGTEAPAVTVTGNWSIRIEAEGQGVGAGTLALTQAGAEFSGTITLDVGTGRIHSGVVSGNSLTFVITIDVGGQSADLDVSSTVEGDTMSGSGSSPFGTFTFTATRVDTPNREVL